VEEIDDAELARRAAAASDPAAEAELCRRLAPRIRLYGLRHLRDPHAAQDLVQQVLLMTLERLRAGEIRDPERIASFALGASRMTGDRDAPRRAAARGAPRGLRRNPEVGRSARAVPRCGDRLAQCLQALAERERSVVTLSFFADKDGDEVASDLGLSAGNVRVIRHRALTKLRQCMGEAA
jgi:RNA polymerase sigma-70 factor, ECF subfamily